MTDIAVDCKTAEEDVIGSAVISNAPFKANRVTEYSGPLSPSIDHIIPMAKKGGHVWNNVQIAHIICNSEKGDKIDKVV